MQSHHEGVCPCLSSNISVTPVSIVSKPLCRDRPCRPVRRAKRRRSINNFQHLESADLPIGRVQVLPARSHVDRVGTREAKALAPSRLLKKPSSGVLSRATTSTYFPVLLGGHAPCGLAGELFEQPS